MINVASIGAFLPMPSTAVYGATKAFLCTPAIFALRLPGCHGQPASKLACGQVGWSAGWRPGASLAT